VACSVIIDSATFRVSIFVASRSLSSSYRSLIFPLRVRVLSPGLRPTTLRNTGAKAATTRKGLRHYQAITAAICRKRLDRIQSSIDNANTARFFQ
jgi:hypothetical protein